MDFVRFLAHIAYTTVKTAEYGGHVIKLFLELYIAMFAPLRFIPMKYQ